MTKVRYLHSNTILETRITEPPKSRSISGYGSKIPTQYMIRASWHWGTNAQWRRVYAICWSNVASHYIVIKKQRWFLHDWDLQH